MPIVRPDQNSGGGGGAIAVTDGVHTVNPATEVDFTAGATVTDAGGGVAQVAISATAGVNSVTAADTSVVVGGTATDPTVRTATLDVIAADHPPAADWSNNSKRITTLLDPSAAQDAATKHYVDTAAPVTSVFARTGAVVAGNADYLAVASGGLTGATAAARYVGGTASGAPVAGTFAVGDVAVDQTGKLWVCTGAGTPGTWTRVGSQTKTAPVPLDTPDASGNGYPALTINNGFSNVRGVVPAFTHGVDGTWEGRITIPTDYASGGTIRLRLAANATTGNVRLQASSAVVADAGSLDPAYTNETATNTTVPGTAKERFTVSFTLSTTPVAGETLLVKITRVGSNIGDTLAVDALLFGCDFEYTS